MVAQEPDVIGKRPPLCLMGDGIGIQIFIMLDERLAVGILLQICLVAAADVYGFQKLRDSHPEGLLSQFREETGEEGISSGIHIKRLTA